MLGRIPVGIFYIQSIIEAPTLYEILERIPEVRSFAELALDD